VAEGDAEDKRLMALLEAEGLVSDDEYA